MKLEQKNLIFFLFVFKRILVEVFRRWKLEKLLLWKVTEVVMAQYYCRCVLVLAY